jgi:hypothetical protein
MSDYFVQNPQVRAIIQENLLAKQFLDALFPELLFRQEFTPEQWTDRSQEGVRTRRGLIPPKMLRLAPKTDPLPSTYGFEQWPVRIQEYGDQIGTDIVVAGLTLADLLMSDAQAVGMSGGQAVNRLARTALYNAAGYGQTVTTSVGAGVNKVVPFLNGFCRAFDANTRRFQPVSAANPLNVYFWTGGVWNARQVIAATPAIPGDEYGPGTITLSVALATAARDPVLAESASYIVRSGGGGFSVDVLGAADLLTLATIREAVAVLRSRNVAPFDDGYYHLHLSPQAEAEIFADTEFLLLHRGRGIDVDENEPYAKFVVATVEGCKFYRNNEVPQVANVWQGTGVYGTGEDFWAGELTNAGGFRVNRTVIAGREMGIEYWKDAIVSTEVGFSGKVGEWNVTNDGLIVMTDRIQQIIRRPMDVMQRVVTTAWAFHGEHVVGTDYLTPGQPEPTLPATTSSAYKRVVVIEHA